MSSVISTLLVRFIIYLCYEGSFFSFLGTKIVIILHSEIKTREKVDDWRKEPFLHTMLTILNLLGWNSANQKFKNYANPTNLANFWMPKMLLFHSHGRQFRSIPVHSPSSFALFRALKISLCSKKFTESPASETIFASKITPKKISVSRKVPFCEEPFSTYYHLPSCPSFALHSALWQWRWRAGAFRTGVSYRAVWCNTGQL